MLYASLAAVFLGVASAASCSSGSGSGNCIDTSSQKCTNGILTPNLCAGANNIECCLTDWGSCSSGGNSGICEVVGACTNGTTVSNLCPGPNSVECCVRASPPTPGPGPNRTALMVAANALYNERANEQYTEGSERWSGIDQKVYPPKAPPYSDCSAAVTWIYWTVYGKGTDFLNGESWSAGYTGTLIDHGKAVAYSAAQPGDLVFYGSTADHITHTAIYIGNGQIISHGSDPVLKGSIDYRSDRQFLRSYI